jgi:hypothetical protein
MILKMESCGNNFQKKNAKFDVWSGLRLSAYERQLLARALSVIRERPAYCRRLSKNNGQKESTNSGHPRPPACK